VVTLLAESARISANLHERVSRIVPAQRALRRISANAGEHVSSVS